MHGQLYEDVLWCKMRSRPECKDLKSSLLFLEIFSYIKGSAEALRTEQGFLSEPEYRQVRILMNTSDLDMFATVGDH